MHINILRFKKFRYLKIAGLVFVAALVLYLSQGGPQPANGGTWQGYVLGGFSAFLVLLLSFLGVRKRAYRSRLGSLEGWTSAHVYLGALLLCTATMHSAFQMGWNVHTLAYVLMLLVIISGFYGIYMYLHYPSIKAKNLANKNPQERLLELQDIDQQIASVARDSTAEMTATVISALERTHLGGGFFNNVRRRDLSKVRIGDNLGSNYNQNTVIKIIADRVPNSIKQSEATALNHLLDLFSRRKNLLRLLRRDLQIQAYLTAWLFIHIPVTVALLAALVVHVVVVFLYW